MLTNYVLVYYSRLCSCAVGSGSYKQRLTPNPLPQVDHHGTRTALSERGVLNQELNPPPLVDHHGTRTALSERGDPKHS